MMSDDASTKPKVHPLVRLMSLNSKNSMMARFWLSELRRLPQRSKSGEVEPPPTPTPQAEKHR